jgi:hypothetical protein
MSADDPDGGDQGAGSRGIPESFRVHFKEDKSWTQHIKSDGTPAGTVSVNPDRPPHAEWMRPTTYTDALPDDEYGGFLRSCGHMAARIERRDFLDDEEPDRDLFKKPKSFQRKTEKSPDRSPPEAPAELPDLVTLSQAAAIVNKSKRALEHYKTRGEFPAPDIKGGGGKADLWNWKTLHPWLEERFGMKLPETFPGNRRNA